MRRDGRRSKGEAQGGARKRAPRACAHASVRLFSARLRYCSDLRRCSPSVWMECGGRRWTTRPGGGCRCRRCAPRRDSTLFCKYRILRWRQRWPREETSSRSQPWSDTSSRVPSSPPLCSARRRSSATVTQASWALQRAGGAVNGKGEGARAEHARRTTRDTSRRCWPPWPQPRVALAYARSKRRNTSSRTSARRKWCCPATQRHSAVQPTNAVRAAV